MLARFVLAALLTVASAVSCPTGYASTKDGCPDINECQLGTSNCHVKAYCTNTEGSFTCQCPRGILGNGITCSPTSFAVRTVVDISGADLSSSWPAFENVAKVYASLLHTGSASLTLDEVARHTADTVVYAAAYSPPTSTATICALFETKALAEAARARLEAEGLAPALSSLLSITATEVDAPAVYALNSQGSTDSPFMFPPHEEEVCGAAK